MALQTWTAEPVLTAGAQLGEGPRWIASERQLLWVDIERCQIHWFDPVTGEDTVVQLDQRVAVVHPRSSGGYVVALPDSLITLDVTTGAQEVIAELGHGPDVRCNEGACDSHGRLWLGTMRYDFGRDGACLYRVSADHSVITVLPSVSLSNGIGWSLDDHTMYYVDSLNEGIDAFDFDPDAGELSHRRRIVEIPAAEGTADGLAVDSEGCLWVAVWASGAVRRYSPDGRLLGRVDVPTDNVTACAFGGTNGTTLFITTASILLDEEQRRAQPEAGSLFAVDVGVAGPPSAVFGG